MWCVLAMQMKIIEGPFGNLQCLAKQIYRIVIHHFFHNGEFDLKGVLWQTATAVVENVFLLF